MKFSILFTVLLLSSSLLAQGRIIILPDEPLPMPRPAEIHKQVVLTGLQGEITITDHVARVKLEQTFHNPNRRNVEGTYLYSFAPGSRLKDFFLYINGRKTAGELMDAGRARDIYEGIVRRMQDPALLEFSDNGLFKARIFPFEALSERKIELHYEQTLKDRQGLYRLTLPIRQSGQGLIEKYALVIHLKTGGRLATVYSPTHEISVKRLDDNRAEIRLDKKQLRGDQNFILYYSESGDTIDGRLLSFRPRSDRDGFFMLFLKPRFRSTRRVAIPRDVVFVVDASGSMGGRKIRQARRALKYCVTALNPEDRFEIIRFSGTTGRFAERLTPAGERQKDDARYFIDNIRSAGGTNLHLALSEAVNMLTSGREGRIKNIIMLTDGLPTEGLTDVRRIVEELNLAAHADIRLFNFGVGYDVNTYLLDRLAEESGGRTEYVQPGESIEASISNLFASLSSPQLTDVRLTFGKAGIDDIYPRRMPDLYEDQRVILLGRYRRGGTVPLELNGVREGRRVRYRYTLELESLERENDFIAGMWAGQKINHLLNRIRFEGENREWVETVRELGHTYGLVTPYTSYLVREEKEAMREMARRRPSAPILQNKRALESDEFSDNVLQTLSTGSVSAGQSFGEKAVRGSIVRKKVLGAPDRQKVMLLSRRSVLGKTFVLKKDGWAEEGLPDKGEFTEIPFNSPAYWALLKAEPGLRRVLALGRIIAFEWQGKLYRITDGQVY